MSQALRQLLSHLAKKPGMALTTAATLAPRSHPTEEKTDLPALLPGEIHEWFSLDELEGTAGAARRQWAVPLTLLTILAGRAFHAAAYRRRIVFIGCNCWPTFQILCAVMERAGGEASAASQAESRASSSPHHAPPGHHAIHRALDRCLFLEPLTTAERFWAIAEALRCPGIAAVIADASGMDATISRRLQLAAESGARSSGGTRGVLGLLARPHHELSAASWAATRWSVHAAPSDRADTRRWQVELVSSRRPLKGTSRAGWGGELAQDARPQWILDWTYQVLRGTGTLHVSPGLGCRTAAAPGAPPPPATPREHPAEAGGAPAIRSRSA